MGDKMPQTKSEDSQSTSKKSSSDKRRKKSTYSHVDSKKTNLVKETADSSEKVKLLESKPGPSSRSDSPEPNCAICLEPLQNKSFTDSCFHTFCFTCLVEWSKVKPECPLCKQQFKSIVHNVKKDLSFDEYYVNSRSSTSLWAYYSDRRFRYPTTMTHGYSARSSLSYQENYQSQIASHRMRYAPHSVRMYSNSQVATRTPCEFRRRIYDQGLRVKPPARGRVRLISPDFFKTNVACTHRLIPWLNRELTALFGEEATETQITFVLELIMALIQRYSITDEEFSCHIEPYIGARTAHFIHEFYHFAASPHDMRNYDRNSNYDIAPINVNDVPSSPDSDIIPLSPASDEAAAAAASYFSLDTPPSISSVLHIDISSPPERQSHNDIRLKKLVLKKNSENTWESIITPGPLVHDVRNYLGVPGPSTSGLTAIDFSINEISSCASFSPLSLADDDDECQVLNVLKPRADRTPEIVDLSSDDENIISVIEVSSGDESNVETSPSTAPPLPTTSAENENFDEIYSDIECIFESETSPNLGKSVETQASNYLKDSFNQTDEVQNYGEGVSSNTNHATDNGNTSHNEEEVKHPTLASAIVRPWDMQPSRRRSASPKSTTSRDKRNSALTYIANSISENYSDDGPSTERGSTSKKLKLCSVVAHFSIDHSESRRESGHRSSHKKHKDKKKKKKKKHVHKHRHRIYSDTESG